MFSNTGQQKRKSLRVISIASTLLNPNMTTKLSYHPTMWRKKGLNKNNYFFCTKTWRFSQIPFMWTAWASEIEWNWNNTAINLIFDESLKVLHCPEVCSSFTSFINSWMLFQYTRSSSIELYGDMSASSYHMIPLRLSQEYSTRLNLDPSTWNFDYILITNFCAPIIIYSQNTNLL